MAPEMQAAIDAATAELARVQPAPPAVGYGVDLDCIDDLTAGLAEIDPNSVRGITQALYHRLTTWNDVSFIREDDPNYGRHLIAALNKGVTTAEITQSEGAIAEECLKDDRIAACEVSVTVTLGPPTSYSVRLMVTPVDPVLGTFPLVISVTDGKILLDATA